MPVRNRSIALIAKTVHSYCTNSLMGVPAIKDLLVKQLLTCTVVGTCSGFWVSGYRLGNSTNETEANPSKEGRGQENESQKDFSSGNSLTVYLRNHLAAVRAYYKSVSCRMHKLSLVCKNHMYPDLLKQLI